MRSSERQNWHVFALVLSLTKRRTVSFRDIRALWGIVSLRLRGCLWLAGPDWGSALGERQWHSSFCRSGAVNKEWWPPGRAQESGPVERPQGPGVGIQVACWACLERAQGVPLSAAVASCREGTACSVAAAWARGRYGEAGTPGMCTGCTLLCCLAGRRHGAGCQRQEHSHGRDSVR